MFWFYYFLTFSYEKFIGSKICSILDENNDGKDDRILGKLYVPGMGSEDRFIIDSETGLVYTSHYNPDDKTETGLGVIGARQPKLEFLVNNLIAKNYLSAFENDKPKLALWMNGGKVDEGKVITGNTLQLYDRKGFEEPTATDSSGNPITPSTALRTVNLIRVADKKTDKDYNRYMQDETVTLAMNYDPSLENPMVTRQGGSLKGAVLINGGAGFNGWAGKIEISKPVSRPWIEWIKDELIDTEEMELTEKESERSEGTLVTGISDYRGPRFVAVNQPRNVTFKYTDSNPYDKNGVFIYPAKLDIIPNTTDVSITPKSPLDGGKIKISLPVEPNVKIEVKGLSESQIETDVIIAVNLPDGRRKFIDTFPISVFDAGLAVDYNRDGEITFDNNDKPTVEKPYQFWVNNDLDLYDPIFGAEKDWQIPNPHIPADNTDHLIMAKRDLEDFARLWIKTGKESLGSKVNELTYGLHFNGGSTARARLFSAIESNGGLKYLQDPAIAEEQVSELSDSHYICDINPAGLSEPLKWGKFSCKGGNTDYFLFEGVNTGSGNMILEVMDGEVCTARYKIPVQLRDIKDFYDFYSVGNNPSIPPQENYSIKRLHSADFEFNNEYLLFVHGWNWPEWEELAYTETMYKRLWWLGYKGHFGMFQWPANYAKLFAGDCEGLLCTQNFDLSEYNAWMSATGLKSLMEELHTNYQGNVSMVAHSQGNVVVSEALRQSIENSPLLQPIVKGYLMLQGAISASYYDSDAPIYDPDERKVANGVLVDNPNIASFYPTGDRTISPDPYFKRLIESNIKLANFYNPDDYAITVGLMGINWIWNNNNKPDLLYGYDSTSKQFYNLVPPSDPRLPMVKNYLDFSDQPQRFTIFSYAAESYAIAIGQNSFKEDKITNINLKDSPFKLTNSWPDHDAEFVDYMAKRWKIWSKVLDTLSVPYNQNVWK